MESRVRVGNVSELAHCMNHVILRAGSLCARVGDGGVRSATGLSVRHVSTAYGILLLDNLPSRAVPGQWTLSTPIDICMQGAWHPEPDSRRSMRHVPLAFTHLPLTA